MAAEKKKKCFVIGPIGDEGSSERTGADWLLEEIIKPALENDPFNYDVQRADEIAKPGSITDQIIGAVIEADLVVADLTGANANAFYELAIRHMEQRAVIHMAKKDQPLPFDIRDFRAVFYSLEHPRDLEEARVELKKQVEAVEDPAYQPSNPITKARGVIKLARTGDPRDKILADLVEGQRSLVEGQRRAEARLKMLEPLTVAPGWPRGPQGTLLTTEPILGPGLTITSPSSEFAASSGDISIGGVAHSEGLKGLLDPYRTAGAKPAAAEEEGES